MSVLYEFGRCQNSILNRGSETLVQFGLIVKAFLDASVFRLFSGSVQNYTKEILSNFWKIPEGSY